jgi:hypothetical protein
MTEFDYELFAIRYATRDAQRSAHFIGGDPHAGPLPADYFVWAARGGGVRLSSIPASTPKYRKKAQPHILALSREGAGRARHRCECG